MPTGSNTAFTEGQAEAGEGGDLPKASGTGTGPPFSAPGCFSGPLAKQSRAYQGVKGNKSEEWLRRKRLGAHPGSEVFPSRKKEPLWGVCGAGGESLICKPLISWSWGGWAHPCQSPT